MADETNTEDPNESPDMWDDDSIDWNSDSENSNFTDDNDNTSEITDLQSRIKTTKNNIASEDPGEEHAKPKAHPEKGTLTQPMVDGTVGLINDIKIQVRDLVEMLKLEELERLINSINKLSLDLNKISSKAIKKSVDMSKELSNNQVAALCESEVVTSVINSTEITEMKTSLESLDLNELQETFIRLQTYLQTRLTFFMENCGGINPILKKLEEELEIFKFLLLPKFDGNIFKVVKQIIEYLKKLSDKLFKEPATQIVYLIAWYTEYGTRLADGCKELEKEIQKALKDISKFSIKIADPKLAQIPILLANIQKIQDKVQKSSNNEQVFMEYINEQLFKERDELEKIENKMFESEEKRNLLTDLLKSVEVDTKNGEEGEGDGEGEGEGEGEGDGEITSDNKSDTSN